MTHVIRKATPADLLAALPTLIHRDPLGSVVLVAFRGNRTRAVLRFDLPSRGHSRFAATAVGTFCKIEGAEGVVPVVWSGGPLSAGREHVETLVRRFRQAGVPIRDALAVGSDGWRSHVDPEGRVHPLSEIQEAAERLALDPPAPVPERVPPADEPSRRRMSDELAMLRMLADQLRADQLRADQLRADEQHDDLGPLEAIADLPLFAEGALSWSDVELEEGCALLLFAVQGPPLRDLVMLQWAFGLPLGDAMWSADIEPESDVDSLAGELLLGRGPSPDADRIEAAIRLLTAVISRADDAERPAPLCMLAWLSWALGRGSIAGVHIDEVRAIAPGYSMGELLDALFGSGTMPEWIFTRRDPQ